ncbi:MAG: hypothetical protein AABY22_08670 [Nanoarchaeota archaeon]
MNPDERYECHKNELNFIDIWVGFLKLSNQEKEDFLRLVNLHEAKIFKIAQLTPHEKLCFCKGN